MYLGAYNKAAPISAIRFYTNKRLERMVIDGNGLVGIGEPTPTAQTHITSNDTTRVALKVDGAPGNLVDLLHVGPDFVIDRDGKIKLPANIKTALTNAATAADIKAVLQQIFV